MTIPKNNVSHFLIRVDGSESIGTGHIMRCLALAGELKKQGQVVSFLTALCPDALKKRLVAEGHVLNSLPSSVEAGSPVDARFTAAAAAEKKAVWVIVDGYHFNGKYQHFIKDAGLKSLFIDDNAHCDYYCADLVLNQNPSATPDLYPDTDPRTRLLLGNQYLLIRDQFLAYKKNNQAKNIELVSKILVTMGGADKDNVSGRVMKALSNVATPQNLEITALIGAGNPHKQTLQNLTGELNATAAPGHHFDTVVNASNMPQLMAEADLIITAGGTTVWEGAYLARPMAVIITADNQKAGMEVFSAQGAVKLLGEQQNLSDQNISQYLLDLINDESTRRALAGKASTLVDGQGASRLVQALTA